MRDSALRGNSGGGARGLVGKRPPPSGARPRGRVRGEGAGAVAVTHSAPARRGGRMRPGREKNGGKGAASGPARATGQGSCGYRRQGMAGCRRLLLPGGTPHPAGEDHRCLAGRGKRRPPEEVRG